MKRYAVLFGMLALAALATSAGAQIPEPSGSYGLTAPGTFAVCLNPTTYAEEACSTSGVLVYPITFVEVGTITYSSGTFCESDYQVTAALPPSASPSSATLNAHTVGKLTSYDAATGTGTGEFTGYNGGSCIGASFDSRGATEVSSGTYQIVVTEGGKRNDVLITSLTNPTNSLGSVSLTATELRQTPHS
jgi:hypothetical protein